MFALSLIWISSFLNFVIATKAGALVRYTLIDDWRLCRIGNNNTSNYLKQSCLGNPNQDPVAKTDCDTRHITPVEQCKGVYVKFTAALCQENRKLCSLDSVHSTLRSVFEESDRDHSIRRIQITYFSDWSNKDSLLHSIDDLLTPRPWLFIRDEKLNKTISFIIIDKYREEYEHYQRHLATIQYPDEYTCRKAALFIESSSMVHPGWAAILGLIESSRGYHPYAVRSFYVTSSNKLNEGTGFTSPGDCPTLVNKWICAFLATTNCSVPLSITNCSTHNCVTDGPRHFINSEVFHLDNRSSLQYQQFESTAKHPLNEVQERFSKSLHLPEFRYAMHYNKSLKPVVGTTVGSSVGLFNKLVIRPNAWYRSLIYEMIDVFQAKNNVDFSDPNHRCVAVHIRRTDRISENITRHCKHNKMDHDRGCSDHNSVPLSLITLEGVLNIAELVADPEVRNLFVMTDDEYWFDQQSAIVRSTHPEWKIFNLPFPGEHNPASRGHMTHREGRIGGILLLAQTYLASQCEGFIAHYGSGIAWMLLKAFCLQHRGMEGVCPSSYDLRSGKSFFDLLTWKKAIESRT